MRQTVIFDIDGTLADISHRLRLKPGHHLNGGRDNPDWKDFMDACVHDKPIGAVIDTANALASAANDIALVTGRMEPWRDETEEWLYEQGVHWDDLFMRPTGDHRPDYVVKEELFKRHLADRPILAVFDDRTRVVKMWRGLGLPCFQVAPGNY